MTKTAISLIFMLLVCSLVNGGEQSKHIMRVVQLDPEKTQQNLVSTYPDYPEISGREEDQNRKIKLLRNKTVIDDKGQSWQFGSEKIYLAKDDTTTQGWFGGGKDDIRVNINLTYHIIKDNDTLFSFSALSPVSGTNGIAKLFLQNGNYIIVYKKFERYEKVGRHKKWITSIHAVVNGEDLNFSCGYENSCAPCFINGQLFYLFQKTGRWGWFFDGIEHLDLWDEVYYSYGDGDCNSFPDPSYKGFKVRDGEKWHIMQGVLETKQ